MSNVIDLLQRLGLEGELPRGPHSMLPLAVVMAPGKRDEDEDEDDEDEDDFDDEDEDDEDYDEDDEDEDDDYDDEDDDGEENSLTPRYSPLRRAA
ncbi:MAG: hypothetical protein JSR66_02735 [Proteobacteria bacterium]|nr:hypothetical protein [Pseudomonadota bacterium]